MSNVTVRVHAGSWKAALEQVQSLCDVPRKSPLHLMARRWHCALLYSLAHLLDNRLLNLDGAEGHYRQCLVLLYALAKQDSLLGAEVRC